MRKEDKTREQLIEETAELRQQVAELEQAETQRKWEWTSKDSKT